MGSTKLKESKEKTEEKKVEKPKKAPEVKKKAELKDIVRVIGTDLNGNVPLKSVLTNIKGISFTMSRAICNASGLDSEAVLKSLSENEIKKLEEVIKNPAKFGIPTWALNRRKDIDTGMDLHLSGIDVDVVKKFDIQKMIDMKSFKGVRHMLGLPVRGQRTRSSFRKGRIVGVVRKAVRVLQEKGGEKEKGKK